MTMGYMVWEQQTGAQSTKMEGDVKTKEPKTLLL